MNNFTFKKKDYRIAIIGLGYIGASLTLEFSKNISSIGYDISKSRVNDLKKKMIKI